MICGLLPNNNRLCGVNHLFLFILIGVALLNVSACGHVDEGAREHSLISKHQAIDTKKSLHKKTRPNIVWLVSEDNSPSYLRLYDPIKGAKTPNIEALAQDGLVFLNAFSNSPVCSTARSTLALGMYPPESGTMHHRAFVPAELPKQMKSVYAYLKDNGYYVSNDVKTDFNFTSINDRHFSLSKEGAHWRGRDGKQAFFHVKSFKVTHESGLMFSESDISKNPTIHNPDTVQLAPYHPDTPLFKYMHAKYLDAHVTLDEQVGDVIQQLVDDGELENTFIFYFADHGGVLPGSKSFATETGLRVPLVVRLPKNFRHLWPNGYSEGEMVKGFINFIDFAPTVISLSGLPSLPQHHGSSFLGNKVDKADVEKRDSTFGFADRFGERLDLVRTIRVGDMKYVRNYLPHLPAGLQQDYRYKNIAYRQWRELYKKGKLNPVQERFYQARPVEALYNVKRDPYELNNLVLDVNYEQDLQVLRNTLFEHQANMPDMGFMPESQLFEQGKDIIAYGSRKRAEIGALLKIANWALLPYEEARPALSDVLQSGTILEKNWALISFTQFGDLAADMSDVLINVLENDTSMLVKARALEVLVRSGAIVKYAWIKPIERMIEILTLVESSLERLEILNIAAGLKDAFGYSLSFSWQPHWEDVPAIRHLDVSKKTMLIHSMKVRHRYLQPEFVYHR